MTGKIIKISGGEISRRLATHFYLKTEEVTLLIIVGVEPRY